MMRASNYLKKMLPLAGLVFLLILAGINGNTTANAAPNWSGWDGISGQTDARPWLYRDGSKLLMAVKGLNSRFLITSMDQSGSPGGWRDVGTTIENGPVIVPFKGKLYKFKKETNGNLYYIFDTLSKWTALGITTKSEPTATVFQDSIFVAVRGGDNQIYISSYDLKKIRSGGKFGLVGNPWSKWGSIGGYSDAAPFIGVYNGRLTVSIKGSHNEILLNTYGNHGWSGWAEVPGNGQTSDSPAFVEFMNKMYLVVRGTNNSVWVNVSERGNWSGWSDLGGMTYSGPAIASLDNMLYVMVRGTDNRLYLNKFGGNIPVRIPPKNQKPPSNWSGWNKYLDGQTLSGPAAAEYNGIFVTMVRGTDNTIYFKTGSGTGWNSTGGATLSSPALAQYNGSLYAIVRGTDDGIYLNKYNGTWQGWKKINGATPSGGGLAAYGGQLYGVVRGTDNAIYLNMMDRSGNWRNWSNMGGATKSEPAAAEFNRRFYIAVRGTDDKIYLRHLDNRWSDWYEVPGNGRTTSGPTLMEYNRDLWLVVRGTDNNIYANILGANGQWSGWNEVAGGGKTDSNPCLANYQGGLRLLVKGTDNNIYYNMYR